MATSSQNKKKRKKKDKTKSQNKKKSKRKTILNYIKKLSLFSELFIPSLVPFQAFFVLKVRGICLVVTGLSQQSHADVLRGSSRVPVHVNIKPAFNTKFLIELLSCNPACSIQSTRKHQVTKWTKYIQQGTLSDSCCIDRSQSFSPSEITLLTL